MDDKLLELPYRVETSPLFVKSYKKQIRFPFYFEPFLNYDNVLDEISLIIAAVVRTDMSSSVPARGV